VAATRKKSALRAVLRGVLVILVVLLLLVAGGFWATFLRPARQVERGKSVQVTIKSGSSTRQIGQKLANTGVVANANMFRVRARAMGADGRLKAGVYDLATGMPYDLVIDRLKAGPPIKYVTVTIPEGFTVAQIAARLEKQAGIPKAEFLRLAEGGASEFVKDHPYLDKAYHGSLEGYLFPKTYRFRDGVNAHDAVEVMLDQFDKEIGQVDLSAADARGFTLPEIVTIASIIEREAQLDKERPLVSSVIYNRLERNMRLEICATIEYVLPHKKFRLTYRDLRIDSPYNSYKYGGLPPGPISNPGLASLQAAANPPRTDYLYYVLTGKDGSHTYTATLKAFLKAKQKSKEVFGR
jgi:UPF0755 protein